MEGDAEDADDPVQHEVCVRVSVQRSGRADLESLLSPCVQVDVFLTRALASKLFLLQVCRARACNAGGRETVP